MGLARGALLVALAACSGSKPPHVEDARRTHEAGSGSGSSATDAAPLAVDAAPLPTPPPRTTGDVQIRVEWPAMPLAARVSPGRSACGAPLAAQVAPTTTWGIPDVVVFVDAAPAARAEDTRVVVDRCSVSPRIAVGATLAIASAATQPLRASLLRRYAATELGRELSAKRVPIALPIGGHEVTTELVAASIYRVAPDGASVDDGWIVSATAFVTDATGVALIKDVPPGTHAVRVWLPPRGGQPARSAAGEVRVETGDLAELTLILK